MFQSTPGATTPSPGNGVSFVVATALILSASAFSPFAAAAADDATPPGWPCVQRYIPFISPGMVWGGDALPEAPARDPDLDRLAVGASRFGVDAAQARERLEAFAAALPESQRREKLESLMVLILAQLNARRDDVIEGILRFSNKLYEQLNRIESLKTEIRAADDDDRAALNDRLHWELRALDRRQSQLRLLCERPVGLERHAFSVGRIILELSDPI